jgi:hypothetical protein
MNVFILNSGRCGSTTFIRACQHITNYTCAHESLIAETGPRRLNYPANHIEADNRLSWFLGRLDQAYGDDAFYVHLHRNTQDTIASFARRIDFGILKAYEQGILLHDEHRLPAEEVASDYLQTVNSNIRHFLKDKSACMDVSLESVETDFAEFWQRIDAQGDRDAALREWVIHYNASG